LTAYKSKTIHNKPVGWQLDRPVRWRRWRAGSDNDIRIAWVYFEAFYNFASDMNPLTWLFLQV
jgi:hypothetical protein